MIEKWKRVNCSNKTNSVETTEVTVVLDFLNKLTING